MPSLRLSHPFRRNAARPSVKATAAKVMRRKPEPRPVADRVREMAPLHPGFVPYPTDDPMSLLRIEMAIPLEAERLLQLAWGEFDRLYLRQSEGLDEAGQQAVADRLRRRFRIDELVAVIDPPFSLPSPDAELLDALDLLRQTRDAQEAFLSTEADDADQHPAYVALEAAWDDALARLGRMRAETLGGLQAKARALRMSSGCVWPDDLVKSLIADLLDADERAMLPRS